MKIGLVKVSVLQIKRPNLCTRRFTAVVLEGRVSSTTSFPICFQTTTVRCCSCSHFMETANSEIRAHFLFLALLVLLSFETVDHFHLYLHLQLFCLHLSSWSLPPLFTSSAFFPYLSCQAVSDFFSAFLLLPRTCSWILLSLISLISAFHPFYFLWSFLCFFESFIYLSIYFTLGSLHIQCGAWTQQPWDLRVVCYTDRASQIAPEEQL